jgi:DNA-binding CsgD family transcriptional regulator
VISSAASAAKLRLVKDVDALERARQRYAGKAWREAHEALTQADAKQPLALEDLWRWVWAASLCGQNQASFAALERIYQEHAEAADPTPAARAAFWLGFRLTRVADTSRASAWLGRAEKLACHSGRDCVEQGYLQIARVRKHYYAGELAQAFAAAANAVSIAERFADPDLKFWAINLKGRVKLREGELAQGLALLDEAMLVVTTGELSPVITALAYCSAIDSCQDVYALERVREWTESMRGWCEAQPQLKSFTGECLVKRAESMELAGNWQEALVEAERAAERYEEWLGRNAAGQALYRQGEIHRLRGDFDLAEERYREASQCGWDPQPGLALLRLAQGRAEPAVQALRRAVLAVHDPIPRAKLLPALIEALLAISSTEEARAASRELDDVASKFGTAMMGALATRVRGAVELAEGDAAAASVSLREAFGVLRQLGAPYWAARARVQLACACQALGDEDGARFEIDAARSVFEQLGAKSELAAIAALESRAAALPDAHGLSPRELEVLRLVASGKTNKLIAVALCLSEKTVDRHVSNILGKLNVPSRAAATAFAYENRLI